MADKYRNKYKISSSRWQEHDYRYGVYYVTICTYRRHYAFGEIKISDNYAEMHLNSLGEFAKAQIENTESIRKDMTVSVPLYVVMPNHIHLVVCIDDEKVNDNLPKQCFGVQSGNLASIIRGIKSKITSFAHENGYDDFAWQSGYYDRVVRDRRELNLIAEYIECNVEKWSMDKYCKPDLT